MTGVQALTTKGFGLHTCLDRLSHLFSDRCAVERYGSPDTRNTARVLGNGALHRHKDIYNKALALPLLARCVESEDCNFVFPISSHLFASLAVQNSTHARTVGMLFNPFSVSLKY